MDKLNLGAEPISVPAKTEGFQEIFSEASKSDIEKMNLVPAYQHFLFNEASKYSIFYPCEPIRDEIILKIMQTVESFFKDKVNGIKQLMEVNVPSIKNELARQIINTKNKDLIKEIINLGSVKFNTILIGVFFKEQPKLCYEAFKNYLDSDEIKESLEYEYDFSKFELQVQPNYFEECSNILRQEEINYDLLIGHILESPIYE